MPSSMVVLAHPRPGSFTHALADAAAGALRGAGHTVARHDLHAEGFDPVLPPDAVATTRAVAGDDLMTTHQRELRGSHTLVVAHPNWWGKPPAIMAGWMDRVLAPGVVYRLDDAAGVPVPLLGLRRLVVLNCGDTDPAREAETFGDPLDAIWRRCVGAYLGDVEIERVLAGPLAGSTTAQRDTWLARAARLACSSST